MTELASSSAGGDARRGRPLSPAAVLVDLDGTVADTENIWMSAETALAGSAGATWTAQMAQSLVGRPIVETAGVLVAHGRLAMSPHQVVQWMLDFVRDSLRRDGVPWRPGILPLLARLRRSSVPCALVTSTYARVAQEVAAAAPPEARFDLVVAGDEVARPKPAPDGYLLAAARLGADIGACLVLEDSPTGVSSGLAAGARVVAIPCVVPVPPRAGLSRVRSALDLDDRVIERILGGETVDDLGPGSAQHPRSGGRIAGR